KPIFQAFNQLKVLIIGDVMVDTYIFGHTTRISPEAPVPVVEIYHRESRLGGAANVALNIQALGATVFLASVVGDDHEGYAFKQSLQANGISPDYIILDQERRTTVKSRVMSRNQQVLRYDYEQCNPLEDNAELLLLDNIFNVFEDHKPDVVIFQDYNKGVLTRKVIANVMHHCNEKKIPTAVDPKKDNFFAYKGCTLFKPNVKEAGEGLDLFVDSNRPDTLKRADQEIRSLLRNTYSVITLSEKGIFVGMEDDQEIIPAYHRNIVDVSGAGDTVISLLALGLAMDLDIFATAELANLAAGLVCSKVGVVAVDKAQLLQEAIKIFENPSVEINTDTEIDTISAPRPAFEVEEEEEFLPFSDEEEDTFTLEQQMLADKPSMDLDDLDLGVLD
ncbi:MAG: bifunctional heptose 7-phosphate kinase/heptose 1-phosphate adenyltransferase, partial [Chitinophagales bacterium]